MKEIFEADSWRLPKGRALDIATGKGRNAIFLAERGFQVVGIDISPVALEMARRAAQEKSLAIDWQEADLERDRTSQGGLRSGSEFNYLQRSLRAANQKDAQARWMGNLRDLFDRSIQDRHPINPDYLLLHNELLDVFRDFRVLYYREGKFLQSGESEFRAGLLAQKGS